MSETLLSFLKDEEGQGMTEYGLIIALVAIAVITALTLMSNGIKDTFNTITNSL